MERFTASDGLSLAYHVDDYTDPWRKPATLLLLHAAMGSAKRFWGWVPHLSRHYRVVRLDLRGHGGSAVPPLAEPLALDRLVADVAELLDHLGCGPAHIVGNSAGGYLAQHLAMYQGARVRSLMLFGSTPGLRNSQAATWVPQIEAKGLRTFLAETIADRFPAGTEPERITWFLDEAAKNDDRYIAKFVRLMSSQDWADELHRIACPTLIVIPGAEPVGAVHHYDPFRQHVKDLESETYEGAPHNIGEAYPDRCAASVLSFLSRRFGLGN